MNAKTAHKEAADIMWKKAGKPKASGTVVVSVIIRRQRVMDTDNAWASCKAIFDSLFKKAITPDDSAQWVQLGTMTQETGAQWKVKPEVEIVVMEAN